jgi:hypothetical protein
LRFIRAAEEGIRMGQSFCGSRRRVVHALALAAIVLAVAVPSAAAQAAGTTVTSSGFGATFFNACTGELIEISGTIHERFHVSGATHVGTSITLSDVEGVGLGLDTGTEYVATGAFLAQTNFGQGAYETTGVNFPQFSYAVNLISKGSGDNLIVHLLFHETWIDGELVVIVDEARSECLG